jgi:hypothetical protein
MSLLKIQCEFRKTGSDCTSMHQAINTSLKLFPTIMYFRCQEFDKSVCSRRVKQQQQEMHVARIPSVDTSTLWARVRCILCRQPNGRKILCIYVWISHRRMNTGRSRWPRGLRHEPSSLARKLGSWVRIALKAWVSVCVFILCLCCPVRR